MNRDWPGKWALPVKDLPPDMLKGVGYPLFEKTIADMHDAFSKGQYGFTTWTFWPGATNSYLIEGIEQVWLNRITTEAYLGRIETLFAQEFKEGKVPPLPPRTSLSGAMWLFALPAILINVCIILIPALLTFAAAFVVWDGVGMPVWAGLANFQRMFDDPVFWSALTNNFIWTAIFLTVPMCMALVMAAALLVAPARGSSCNRIIFLPRILAVAVTGRIFQGMIFSPATGMIAWLNEHGLSISDPLADPDRSLYRGGRRRHLALVGISGGGVPRRDAADQHRPDRGGAARRRRLLRSDALRAVAGNPADAGADADPHRDLVVPGVRIHLHRHAGRARLWQRGAGDAGLSPRLLRERHRPGRGGACVMSLFGLCATAAYIWLQIRDGAQRDMIESRWSRTVGLTLIGVASFASLLPIVLAVINAFKTTVEISTNPLALPAQLHWENFASAWRNAALGPSLLHSAEVAGLTIVLVCLTAAPCAYVLARQQGRGWRFLTFYFMARSRCRCSSICIPLYFMFAKLGLVNSIPAVALIYTAMFSPFAIFLLRTYVLAIPLCAGGSRPGRRRDRLAEVLRYVILPMMRPGLLTVAIIVGLNAWNEFVIAVTFLQNDNNVTAIVKFYNLTGQYSTDWGEMLAAAVTIVLPVVLVFVLLQRRFIDGMTAGAVKS